MKGHSTLVVVGALLLAACGSGGDTTTGPTLGGIQGSGHTLSVGVITGFGSIFVNGIEYSTSAADIRLDGRAGSEADLRVGQVVRVKGSVDAGGKTGTATSVTFAANVTGPVSQVDAVSSTFVVLGQTIRTTPTTVFDDDLAPASMQGLSAPGLVVEVSGFVMQNGDISATRIERDDAAEGFEVRGTIADLDTAARTFGVNALLVDYSGAVVDGTLAPGSDVEVEGDTFTAAGALVATRVEVESDDAEMPEGSELVLEGLITQFSSTSAFEVDGRKVMTHAGTSFELNGAVLAADVRVEVEGTLDANGTLVADEVEIERDSSAGVAGKVESIAAADQSIQVAGVTVKTSARTQFEDKRAMPVRHFGFADLRVGDFVDVRGSESGSGGLVAVVLERDDAETESTLRGKASGLAEPSLVLLGVNVTADAGASYEDANGNALTQAQFFVQAVGRIVTVEGRLVGTTLVADELEIEEP